MRSSKIYCQCWQLWNHTRPQYRTKSLRLQIILTLCYGASVSRRVASPERFCKVRHRLAFLLSLLDSFVLLHREGEHRSSDEEYEPPPEESIPDLPENAAAREFLKKAPTKGLWMPLGKEVKVMQCWRCKAYGHRTGDKECPLSKTGNITLDIERQVHGFVIVFNCCPHSVMITGS